MMKIEIKVQDGAEAIRVVAACTGHGWRVQATVEDISGRPEITTRAMDILERQIPGINRALEVLAS